MLRLRPYKTSDAKTIISWCKDEVAFRKWTSDRYESFPITEEDMNQKYVDCNGDCCEPDNFYPMTAFDESGIVGHLIMRYTDEEKKVLRLRFGLDDGRQRTLEEVGKEFNVTRERIRQIEAKALRKLRHPSRRRKLRDFLE